MFPLNEPRDFTKISGRSLKPFNGIAPLKHFSPKTLFRRRPASSMPTTSPESLRPVTKPYQTLVSQFLPSPRSLPFPAKIPSSLLLSLLISFSRLLKTSPDLFTLSSSKSLLYCPFSRQISSIASSSSTSTAAAFFDLSVPDLSPATLRSCFITARLVAAGDPQLKTLAHCLLSSLLARSGGGGGTAASDLLSWAHLHRCHKSYYSALDLSLRAFLGAKMPSEALQTVNRMRDCGLTPSLSALALLIRLLFRVGEEVKAWNLFKDMLAKGPCPSVKTFNAMILGFCRKGSVGIALGLLGLMSKFDLEPDACSFNIVMKAHCVVGRTGDAFKVFALMLQWGYSPSVVTYNILVDALCREGRVEDARGLFDEMEREGIEGNTITYNALISGYVKAGKLEKAEEVYGQMKMRGLVPDCYTFNILAVGYSKFRRNWRGEREKLMNHMLSLEVLPEESRLDVLVSSYCLNEQLEDAREWLQCAIEDGAGSIARFNSVIAAYSKRGVEDEALKFYHVMVENGFSPSAATCNSLLIGLCKSGRLDEAQELMDRMVERGFCVNLSAYTICIVSYFRAGDVDGARNCWDEMERQGVYPDVIAYSAYINGFCRANYVNEALDAFYEMGRRGLIPNNFVYNSLISGFCRIGNVEEALKLEGEMRKSGLVPDIFTSNIIIDGYCRERMLDKAIYKLKETYENGMVPDIVTYNTFISAYCKDSDIGSAVNFLNRMHLEGWEPDIFTYNILIHALCCSHTMGEAMGKLDELVSVGLVPNSVTCNTVMNGICVDVLDRAIIMTGKLLKMAFVPNAVTVNLILSHFCKQNMAKRALMWEKKLREVSFIFDDATENILSWAHDKQEIADVSMLDSGKSMLLDFLLHITYDFLLRNEPPNSRLLMISSIIDHGFPKSSSMMDVR